MTINSAKRDYKKINELRKRIFMKALLTIAVLLMSLQTLASERCPLIKAVYSNNSANVIEALNSGEDIDDVDCYGSSALQVASKEGFFRIAQLLIDRKADVNIYEGVFLATFF